MLKSVTSEIVQIGSEWGTTDCLDLMTFLEKTKRLMKKGFTPQLSDRFTPLDYTSTQTQLEEAADDAQDDLVQYEDRSDDGNEATGECVDDRMSQASDKADAPNKSDKSVGPDKSDDESDEFEPAAVRTHERNTTPTLPQPPPSETGGEYIESGAQAEYIESVEPAESDSDSAGSPWNEARVLFGISSTARAAGRPSIRKKQIREKRSASIESTKKRMQNRKDDLDTLCDQLKAKPTYNSASESLKKYKVVSLRGKFTVKIKLRSKACLDLREINEILPTRVLEAFRQESTKFSSRRLAKKGSPVHPSALGYVFEAKEYSLQALTLMRQWHDYTSKIHDIEEAASWLAGIDVEAYKDSGLPETPWTVDEVLAMLRSLTLSSRNLKLLTFAGRRLLDDECMQRALELIAKNATDAVAVNVLATSVPFGDSKLEILTDAEAFMESLLYLVAVHLPAIDHWCGAIVDWTTGDDEAMVIVFDPMTSYGIEVKKHVTEVIDTFIQEYNVREMHPFDQHDNYNCGVYVLMTLELYVRQLPVNR